MACASHFSGKNEAKTCIQFGSWVKTKNTPEVEFPYIKSVYALYEATDRVENKHLGDEGHDYGPSKRAAVYSFLARHLGLDITKIRKPDGAFDETEAVLPEAGLRVFSADHPRPPADLKDSQSVGRALRKAQGRE